MISRQTGWSSESNLLYQILGQLTRLTSIIFNLKPKYKVFTALLTQSGNGNNNTTYGNAGIIKGITYYISINPDNYDLTIYGSPNNIGGTSFIANQTITLPYTDTLQLNFDDGAPVANVLENTIGNIWFTYNSVGYYYIQSNELFTSEKMYLLVNPMTNTDLEGNAPNCSFTANSTNQLQISTNSSGSLSNDLLYNTPIEIRIYN